MQTYYKFNEGYSSFMFSLTLTLFLILITRVAKYVRMNELHEDKTFLSDPQWRIIIQNLTTILTVTKNACLKKPSQSNFYAVKKRPILSQLLRFRRPPWIIMNIAWFPLCTHTYYLYIYTYTHIYRWMHTYINILKYSHIYTYK